MMVADSYEEMREIANGCEEALYIVDKLEKLAEDDKFRTDYNVELVRRKEINSARLDGYDAGAKEREKEIAKNLLNIGISKEDIIKSTGLSEEEINNLIEEL